MINMMIGYARVSTVDQNLELQIQELEKTGCEKIYREHISGRKEDRPELTKVLDDLRKGDALVVWKLDRLARTVKQLIAIVEELSNKGINFISITDKIDTSTTAGKFFFHVMSALAEMEANLIRERTMAALAVAKSQGRVGGRKKLMTDSKIESAKKLLSDGIAAREVAKNLGISIATLYRHIPSAQELAR